MENVGCKGMRACSFVRVSNKKCACTYASISYSE